MKGGSFFMAKRWGQRVKSWMTQTMDLPQDVMMDLPRITMIGQIHIYIAFKARAVVNKGQGICHKNDITRGDST
jgi:hypothetical protein